MKTWKKAFLAGSVVAAIVAAPALRLLSSEGFGTHDFDEVQVNQVLEDEGLEVHGAAGGDVSIDAQRPHLAVEGTSIDCDLAQATEELGNGYYLNHDCEGNASETGCPFVDYRTSFSARHAIAYAHGLTGRRILFSELKHAYEQDVFDMLGKATVFDEGLERIYMPVMALHVDESYQLIQQFAFAEGDLQPWLLSLKEDANALASDADEQIGSAEHVLTLVTCSSYLANQPERTLVIFVSAT